MLFVEEFAEFVECERKYEKNYVHCFVDRKFLEISREFESRDCVMLSSICTVAQLSSVQRLWNSQCWNIWNRKSWRYFCKIVQKAPRNNKIITRMVPVIFVHKIGYSIADKIFITKNHDLHYTYYINYTCLYL